VDHRAFAADAGASMTDTEHDIEHDIHLDHGVSDDIVVDSSWTEVCPVDRLPIDRGVAAIVDGDQVAVFRLSPINRADGDSAITEEFAAVSHIDPVTGSPVMARGLVGSVGAPPLVIPTVASPLHKQRYNLRSGACLDDSELTLEVFELAVVDSTVFVRRQRRPD